MGNRYMLSYEKTGKPMKLIYADSLVKLQDKAQQLRKRGFAIGKFGLRQPRNELPSRYYD